MEKSETAEIGLFDLGENRVVALSSAERDGWVPLAGNIFSTFSKGTSAENKSFMQVFEMHPDDYQKWMSAKKYGSEGYSFATMWEDNRIAGNARIRPATVNTSSPSCTVPPSALVTFAFVASQMLARFDALEAKLDILIAKVDEISRFLEKIHFSRVTSVIREMRSVHANYLETGLVGSMDWSRIQDHGRILNELHEMVVMELEDIREKLSCTNIAGAKVTLVSVHSRKLQTLIDTEFVLIELYEIWNSLYVMRKFETSENSKWDSSAAERRLAILQERSDLMFASFNDLDKIYIHGRGIAAMLMKEGLIVGPYRDNQKREKVQRLRKKCMKIIQNRNEHIAEDLPTLRLVTA